jgi:hypothetical protein
MSRKSYSYDEIYEYICVKFEVVIKIMFKLPYLIVLVLEYNF